MTSTGNSKLQKPVVYQDQLAVLERKVLSEPSVARQSLLHLVEKFNKIGDINNQAKAVCLLSGCDFFESKYLSTIRHAQEALRLSRIADNKSIESRCLNALGLACQRLDRIEEALNFFEQSADVAEQQGDLMGYCRAINNMSTIYVQTGGYIEAIEMINESIQIAREHDFDTAYADALCVLAEAQSRLGQHQVVLNLAEEAADIFKDEELYRYKCYFSLFHVQALLSFEYVDEAQQIAIHSFQIGQKIDDYESRCTTGLALGRVYLALGKPDLAVTYLKEALESALSGNKKYLANEIYEAVSSALESRGKYKEALKYARTHFERERELHNRDLDYRAGAIATQAKVEILHKEAKMEKLRNEELAQANKVLQRTQKELEYQANHDALTGLASRSYFFEKAQQEINRLSKKEKRVLIFIDLDQFKEINDSQGHHAGDFVLKEIAQRLIHMIAEKGLVGRMGGDEFTILLQDISDEQEIISKINDILQKIRQPVHYEGQSITVTASIGYIISPDDGDDLEVLQRYVDLAMYSVKRSGRDGIKRFHIQMSAAEEERRELRKDLYTAVRERQLHLNYQGIFNTAGQLTGFEALCRWTHHEKGPVSPGCFISIAEEDDQLILDIGQLVLDEACRYAANNNFLEKNLFVSVNVSPVQFDRPDFVHVIECALDSSQVSGQCLILELTESMVLQDPELANKHICELKKLGVRVSMDDFGTGYSSLSMLHSLPFSYLKIDRSFIRELSDKTEEMDRSYLILKVMIDLAHSLDMLVVAEGVETEDQHELLTHIGCDKVQGFLLSKPLMPEMANEMIKYHQESQKILH